MTKHESPSSTTSTLNLSSLHLRLQGLEQENQWLLKQIKRKRTELKNFVEQMRSVATQIFHQGQPLYQKLLELDGEIHAIFAEIFSTRKFGGKIRQSIEEIYKLLQFMGIVSPKLEEEETEELDDLFEAGEEKEPDFGQTPPEDFFTGNRQQGQPTGETEPIERSPKTPESKQIRRTFRRLAEIFHPDKVTDPETQMRHTEIMKEINRAYKEGDLARLLEIEQQHQAGEAFSVDSSSENDLLRQCERLATNNQLLKTQYENLKRELRLVKNTPEGEMVKDYRAAVRQGIDPIQEMLAETEVRIQGVEKIRNFVRDFRDKKITIRQFLQGPPGFRRSSYQEMKEMEEILNDLDLFVRF